MNEDVTITPQTKVAELVEAYPDLEEVLVEIAPAFKKLSNPVLRRTVARVTSLSQAARVGGVPVGELIRRLREAAGHPEWEEETGSAPAAPSGGRPEWVDSGTIHQTLDARPIIEAGEEPLGRVMRDLKDLPEGEIYELITPFEPAPLIDRARGMRFTVWTTAVDVQEHRTYFTRR